MALNPKVDGKRDSECTETSEIARESGDSRKNPLSAATSATSNQNGDQAGFEDGVMPEKEASDRRKSGLSDARSSSNSPLPGQRPTEELPRRNFQIPRKIKERKGLYQFLPPESREFEDLVKILSSFYLDISSRGTFSYYKARLIHNELLEKEFVEKKRELKQDGRTEPELVESYCFLFPEKSKLPWICEKGLSVGHTRVTTLGNPSLGVYLSKYSDLLQMNPFEVGASGDIVIFKVMRGRLKTIHENMPKSVIEPNPKFDCHVSKNATRVTSLLSYRAFELTQQYYFEFAFEEIKSRPRHVCPYAVISFQYKGKESAGGPMLAHRFNSGMSEGGRGPGRSYTVWSGPLVNKGQELCQVSLRSTTRPYLPIKLPEKLELSRGMQLDQVKRKIPSVLFSWDTYRSTREVLKGGMSCSLFEVVDGRAKVGSGGSLSGLLHKLERDRMVLVKPLLDKGFLFLLSSAQMVNPNEQHGRFAKSLQALFIFQESRGVVKYTSRLSEPEFLSAEPPPPVLACLSPFVPALHYALYKLRSSPCKDLSSGVERQAQDYLRRRESGQMRPFVMHDYKQSLDERVGGVHPPPPPRSKPNIDGPLRSYIHGPASYILPLAKARDAIQRVQQPPPAFHAPPAHVPSPVPAPTATEYSPVSDWGGSGGSDRTEKPGRAPPASSSSSDAAAAASRKKGGGVSHSNGSQPHPRPQQQQAQRPRGRSQSEYDKDKMTELLKLIQTHKKTQLKEPGREGGRRDDGPWDPNSLKRKLEQGSAGPTHNKHHRLDAQSNGEPSRAHGDDGVEEGQSLSSVMESMGFYDTDLRDRGGSSSNTSETQRLLKILLDTLNKAMAQGAGAEPADNAAAEPPAGAAQRAEPTPRQEYPEEEAACSLGSPMSTCSMEEQPHSSDKPQWAVPSLPDKPQAGPDPAADGHPELKKAVEAQVPPQPLPEVQPQVPTQPLPQAPTQPRPQVQPQIPTQPRPQVQPQNPTQPLPQVPSQPLPEVPTQPLSEVQPEPLPQVQHQIPPQPLPQSQTPQPLPQSQTPQPLPQVQPRPQIPPPGGSLDSILNQELHRFSSDIQSLMQSQQIYYTSRLPRELPQSRAWLPNSSFSEYVTPYVTPVPVQGHVSTLRERMGGLINPDLNPDPNPPTPTVPPPPHASNAVAVPAFAHLPPPPPLAAATASSPAPLASPAARTKAQPPGVKSSSSKRKKPSAKAKPEPEIYSPSQVTTASPDASPTTAAPGATTTASAPPVPGLLFGQLKPDVFSSLVEIFKDVQKNTVKFYIHPGDEGEESAIGVEIKEYLQSLGNAECKPQSFLENSSNMDKLLIIIQNEDIAAHVHKIPALVSLKKCSTVSFAGVDSLDDVKNHTYNELFVSGGFIVSDEFVLNPDFITQDRLQAFLKFLEEQSSPENPWQWKVHCKSQKKLKELGRLNSNAMGLLNLLTAYQKKHLVEFLPYHECDTQSRQAPDLDCLVKLQAQHTQQRHLIFLTERRFEMFLQYSRNGIVIASIDDIMNSFHSLIGGINQNELPTPPSTVVNDECVEEEDMSLDSDEDTLVTDEQPGQTAEEGHAPGGRAPRPPLPEAEEFRPPLPDQLGPPAAEEQAASSSLSYASLCDLAALKTAISQFKATSQAGGSSSSSAGGFAVNPHQSFLCPSTPWAPFPGYSASPAYPASPCSGTQEQDYRGPATAGASTSTSTPAPTLAAGPLTSQPPLPLEVKPPPPPHLMHLYVPSQTLSGSNAALTAGAGFSRGGTTSVLPSAAPETSPSLLVYPDPAGASSAGPTGFSQADVALHSFATGVTPTASAGGAPTPGQGDRTLAGPGEGGVWGTVGNSTCEAPSSQGGGGLLPHSALTQGGEREWTEAPGGSTPGSQGGRTPVNCTDSHGVGVGVPPAATRGGSAARPMGGAGGGYGCIGSMPGQLDGSLPGALGPGSIGGYRGRGAPPGGPWPRPGRGHERGEGTGGWGYPLGRGGGQDYYSDYT